MEYQAPASAASLCAGRLLLDSNENIPSAIGSRAINAQADAARALIRVQISCLLAQLPGHCSTFVCRRANAFSDAHLAARLVTRGVNSTHLLQNAGPSSMHRHSFGQLQPLSSSLWIFPVEVDGLDQCWMQCPYLILLYMYLFSTLLQLMAAQHEYECLLRASCTAKGVDLM